MAKIIVTLDFAGFPKAALEPFKKQIGEVLTNNLKKFNVLKTKIETTVEVVD